LVSAWQKHDDANDEIVKINATLEQRIKERTKELKEAKDVAEKQAGTDPLTGLENRLHLENNIEKVIKYHILYNAPYSLLLFDIDWFKKVNDDHGHDMGDVVLKQVASILTNAVREEDKVYRIGGEEFVVLLKRIKNKHIYQVAEKIRKNIEQHLFVIGDKSINVTISGGLYHSSIGRVNDYHDLLKIVDQALYQSKENGRNQITSYQAS
jgi:diguanylate cyclase (GGDEF)-like protein